LLTPTAARQPTGTGFQDPEKGLHLMARANTGDERSVKNATPIL